MATIRKRGDRYQVQVRRKGVTPLSRSFLTKRDAELWARQTELQADRKELPKDPRQLERFTLRDLVIRYRDTVSPRKRGGDVEQIVLNAFLRHPICNKRLSVLSPTDFAQYRDERLQKIRAITLKREFSSLQHLFEVAKNEWGLPIRNNYIKQIRFNAETNRRERRLRPGEFERITTAAKACRNPFVLPIILFALETALRRSEILAASWSHLQLNSRLLTLPRAKNGHSRVIPLSLTALQILDRLQTEIRTNKMDDDRIFPLSANGFKLAWKRVLRRAKIEGLRFHDLRHEAISRFFEFGLTAPEVASISGHRDMRMLFRYSHSERQRVLRQLDTIPPKEAFCGVPGLGFFER
jgi:integrase